MSEEARLSLLLIDDEPAVDRTVGEFLRKRGFEVSFAPDAAAALALFRAGVFDLVISDIKLPGMDGLALLEKIRAVDPDIDAIFITGQGELESATRALRAGASDYLLKPLDLPQLRLAVERAARFHLMRRENETLREQVARNDSPDGDLIPGAPDLLGVSPAIQRVKNLVASVSRSPETTALITGESGTGKEIAARLLHRLGARAGAFVPVNCLALPREIFESELLGHEKGAFTGALRTKKGLIELADNGTLFLDEIGDMPLELQGRLLRILEDRHYRRVGGERTFPAGARFVAATNQKLDELAKKGVFARTFFIASGSSPSKFRPSGNGVRTFRFFSITIFVFSRVARERSLAE